jgi:SOS-response transcriptional repressor LexA
MSDRSNPDMPNSERNQGHRGAPSELGTPLPAPVSTDDTTSVDREAFAEAIGKVLASNEHSLVWSDPRFLTWMAKELRAGEDLQRAREGRRNKMLGRRGVHDDQVRRGEALMARVAATRMRVSRRSDLPRLLEREDIRSPEIAAPLVALGVAAGVGRELWDEIPTTWVEVPADMPNGRYMAFRIVGDSMTPLIKSNDVVLVRIGSEVEKDTVIIARRPDAGYVCKSVSRLTRKTIELSSLAPDRELIVIPREPALIVGTVMLVWSRNSSGEP